MRQGVIIHLRLALKSSYFPSAGITGLRLYTSFVYLKIPSFYCNPGWSPTPLASAFQVLPLQNEPHTRQSFGSGHIDLPCSLL